MSPSKVWTNQGVNPNLRTIKKRKKKQHVGSESSHTVDPISEQKKMDTLNVPQRAPSFLETLSQITQSIDLLKIKEQMTEINKIFEQVNGFMSQINQLQGPPKHRMMPRPYPPFYHNNQHPPNQVNLLTNRQHPSTYQQHTPIHQQPRPQSHPYNSSNPHPYQAHHDWRN